MRGMKSPEDPSGWATIKIADFAEKIRLGAWHVKLSKARTNPYLEHITCQVLLLPKRCCPKSCEDVNHDQAKRENVPSLAELDMVSVSIKLLGALLLGSILAAATCHSLLESRSSLLIKKNKFKSIEKFSLT